MGRLELLLTKAAVCLGLLASVSRGQNERPAFATPKFATNVHHRTNVCNRHEQLVKDELSLPDALKGLNLSVILTDYDNDLNKELFALENGGIPDNVPLFAQVMDELASRAGFTWRNSYGAVKPLSRQSDGNKTWSDLLKWEVQTFDIAMGRWDRTSSRIADEISFPEGWYDSSIILVQTRDGGKKDLNIWSFMLPFKTSVWFLIFATLVVSGWVYYLLERLDNAADLQQLESEPASALYYSFITFTGHNEFRPRTHAARLLAFSMTLWALIVAAAYTANLASFLVARAQPETSFQTVAQAVSIGAPICLQEGAALYLYIQSEYGEKGPKLVPKRDDGEVFQSLMNGECGAAVVPQSVYETFRRDENVNAECNLIWTGQVEQFVPSGLATLVDTGDRCSSLISHVIDYHFLRMQADGFFEEKWESFLSRISNHNCASDTAVVQQGDDETFSLSAAEMSGIFIVHAVLTVIALGATLIKCFLRRTFPNTWDGDNSKGDEDGSPETMDLGLETTDEEDQGQELSRLYTNRIHEEEVNI